MHKARLKDVAQRAKVSNSTVSQYLNGRFDYMSKETQQRIKAAVEELNYTPNPTARNLKGKQTKMVGVVVRDITGFDTSKTIRGIDDYCKKFGYNAIVYNTDFDPEEEKRALESLNDIRVDGIIIASSGKNESLIKNYDKKGLPIVHFQLEHDGSEKRLVTSDYWQAAYDATQYLLSLGHKQVSFVTQTYTNVLSRKARFDGYKAALEANNIEFNNDLILYWDRNRGFETSPVSLLEKENAPTAFFSQHLAITTELLTEFNQHSVSIPEDVSLIGFDEIPMAKFFSVPVSVVKQEPYQVGQEAAKLLLNSLKSLETENKRVRVNCTLTKRASCAPPK
ncbi:LacI family DNA-binding transcriptional regulator [Alteromonas portus]|uniref:LacI family DNA-binding transcriptional regulator n=1 Tax=Alteromonas portus TaxID=2565549 RepID=UPI003BF8213D